MRSEMESDLSYNMFLYRNRTEQNKKKRKFAKEIGIRPFRYRLIENGYIKPSDRDVRLISDFFGVDYGCCLEGFRGYPTELDNKKYLRFVNHIYYLFTKKALRITLLILTLLFLSAFIAALFVYPHVDTARVETYGGKAAEVKHALLEKGRKNFSVYRFSYPAVSEIIPLDEENERAVIIDSLYDPVYLSLSYSEIIWYGNLRFYIGYIDASDGETDWLVTVYDYETNQSRYLGMAESDAGLSFSSPGPDTEVLSEIMKRFDIGEDFDRLIREKLGVDVTFRELTRTVAETRAKNKTVAGFAMYGGIVSLLLACVFGFLFGYATIYKKEKDQRLSFSHSDDLLGASPEKHTVKVKKDLRFTPFIPETVLRIIGILLVFLGSIRLLFYVSNVSTFSSVSLTHANDLYSVQLIGIFLIFFINFDVYMDDNRLFRNLMLYPMAFLIIYATEAAFMSSLGGSETILTYSLEKVYLPNPFGAATCYFLIMVFLFFTPGYVKTKKGLIVYRSMAAIPVCLLIVSFLLGNYEAIFGGKISSYWIQFLFRDNRFSLSVLAILYLVSLFFLRLHYKRKFGEQNAMRYFMGNRFIMRKNLIAAGLIVAIWLFEMIASANPKLAAAGIGQNKYLIILAPLIFFYHPHKNARNTKVDVALIILYVLVLAMLYLLTGMLVLYSIVN